VDWARVSVSGTVVGSINIGLLVLIGVGRGDTLNDARYTVDKVLKLRIFPYGAGKFDRSVLDVDGDLLVVSQFTLYAETRRGRRPDFGLAASPQAARGLFDETLKLIKASGLRVASGCFQEHMVIELQNNGPVTILIDSSDHTTPTKG
jgi:D-tyrosyl-tRNA(Tyr) deacylase